MSSNHVRNTAGLKKTRRRTIGRKSKRKTEKSDLPCVSLKRTYTCGELSTPLEAIPRKKAKRNSDKDNTLEYCYVPSQVEDLHDPFVELSHNDINYVEDSCVQLCNDSPNEHSDRRDYNLSYVDKCLYDLRNGTFLIDLLNILRENGCLQDFMILLQLIVGGTLSPKNLAFLLCLERAKWEDCKNTCGMRYRDVTRQFWEVVYKVCKGITVNLFRGRKNRTDVINEETTRGYYDPRSADINFAVPDNKVLQKGKFATTTPVKPTIFGSVLENMDKGKEYILSFDGKRVARGLGKGSRGDVDLWGYEEPSVDSRNLKLCQELLEVSKLNAADVEENPSEVGKVLRKVLLINSNRMKEMRISVHKQQLKLDRLLNPPPSSKVKQSDFAISHHKTMIYAKQEWITATLHLNKDICEFLAKLQRTNHFFSYAPGLTLAVQHNCRCLHDTAYVKEHVNLEDFPHLCKQRTEEWFNFRKMAHVTGIVISWLHLWVMQLLNDCFV